jgi:cytochrome P450
MSNVSTGPDVGEVDLTDPRTFAGADMAGWWRHVRGTTPVYQHRPVAGGQRFWVVAGHAEASAVYRDAKRFSASRGNMLSTLLAGGDSAGGRMVAVSDGPRHRRLRTAILQCFSQRALDYVTQRIREYTSRLVEESVARGEVDFAADVGARVPINTICDLLGVPEGDRDHLLALNKKAVSSDVPDQSDDESRLARGEIVMYLTDLVKQMRGVTGDGVIPVLANTTVEGEMLSSHDIVLNCYSLLLGGDETSRFSMIAAVDALYREPAQWSALRDGEVALDTATEEIIRWATPIMHVARTALTDVAVGDATIKTGDIVTIWNSSTNHDEDVFDRPDVLDLARHPNRHLAFGLGAHFCVGVFLARAEISALLDALRTHVSRIEPTGASVPIYSNVLQGSSSLPVRLHPVSNR